MQSYFPLSRSLANPINRVTLALLVLNFAVLGCADEDPDGEDPGIAPPELVVSHSSVDLTELAEEAVAMAPAWLRDDLIISFDKLEDSLQDDLALLIVDVEDPYLIDEIGFAIAHTSPEVLSDSLFFPELLMINATLIYAYDGDLDYVELVDEGEPGVDDDYYTTATYLVEREPGVAVEETIDRDMYYWYVVHPRLQDEWPNFIDAWISGHGADPADGYFWREFLWDKGDEECPADRECPQLMDHMQDTPVVKALGDEGGYERSGHGQVWSFIGAAINWGAGDERPVQPCRIYAVGCGNCGEYEDLFVSSARTALIPARNVGAFVNDHVWGEWWGDEQWWGEFGKYVNGVRRDRADNDCDGTADDALDDEDQDGDGVTLSGGDCHDGDAAIYPGATEVQNGYDDDCDGIADDGFVDSELDGDGDGLSIAGGDCDDFDAAIYPGAVEVVDNGYDDDCDGVADDGLNEDDADGDGITILDGDCNDTLDTVFPWAEETANGYDDNCDGVADEGFTHHDRDNDGLTLADGDCNDLSSGYHPDVDDPGMSSNRLYIISDTRGDALIGTERTVFYGTLYSTLEFEVVDEEGTPVDGALINLFGTWEVYGYPDQWGWTGMLVTGLDGRASAVVGEENPYGYQLHTPIGDNPVGNYLHQGVTRTKAYETYTIDDDVPGVMPTRLDVAEADLAGGNEAGLTLDLQFEVESHRVTAPSPFGGSFSVNYESGRLDLYLVDEDNLERFEDGDDFEAQIVELDVTDGAHQLDLPHSGSWTLLLANPTALSTTMVGSVTVSAQPVDGVEWDGDAPTLETRFQIPPGEYLGIELR